jgi:hypothetical protein
MSLSNLRASPLCLLSLATASSYAASVCIIAASVNFLNLIPPFIIP